MGNSPTSGAGGTELPFVPLPLNPPGVTERHHMTATQSDGVKQMQNGDPIWERILNETREAAAAEPILASFLLRLSSTMTNSSAR